MKNEEEEEEKTTRKDSTNLITCIQIQWLR